MMAHTEDPLWLEDIMGLLNLLNVLAYQRSTQEHVVSPGDGRR